MAATTTMPRSDPLAAARVRTLVVLWTTYGSFYLCRANFGPVRSSMQSALGLSAVEMGLVLGSVKLGYALGQLVNGQLTERLGPRRILTAGMIGSAVATLLLAASPALAGAPLVGGAASVLAGGVASMVGAGTNASSVLGVLLALAFANGWFQAGGWPPCVKIAGSWFAVQRRGFTMGVLGTSLTIGSALAIAIVGFLLWAVGGWRVAFVVPALMLLASLAHTATRLRESPPSDIGGPSETGGDASTGAREPSPAPTRLPLRVALWATIGNPRIWVLAFGLFGVDAVRYGFLDWAPGHLSEAQGSGAWASAMKTAVFPLAGAVGALSSGWLTDRFFEGRRAPVCAILLGAVAALTLAYRVVVGMGAAPTIVCLALVGLCLYGAQILLVGTAAQDFARRGATAGAAGFVDFVGHTGAFSGDFVTGLMLKRHGWAGAIAWWASAAFVAAALVATLWNARPSDRIAGAPAE
jgi:sugar phosphate permease